MSVNSNRVYDNSDPDHSFTSTQTSFCKSIIFYNHFSFFSLWENSVTVARSKRKDFFYIEFLFTFPPWTYFHTQNLLRVNMLLKQWQTKHLTMDKNYTSSLSKPQWTKLIKQLLFIFSYVPSSLFLSLFCYITRLLLLLPLLLVFHLSSV